MDGRKKNKKKKGTNQSKTAKDAAQEQDNGSVSKPNHIPHVLSTSDVQSVGVSESDAELDRHKLYEERFGNLHREVRQLEDEKNHWLQKEASLEEKIIHLQVDISSCIENKASLEEKLKSLQSGNNLLMHKQASLEDRVKHVEGLKDIWSLKERLISEMSSRLDEFKSKFEEQVKELRESKDVIVQENTQLKESMAALESRVKQMEREITSSTAMTNELAEERFPQYHQPEADPPSLLEKREPEKAEHIQMVKDVHIESDQHPVATDHYTTDEHDHVKGTPEPQTPIGYTPEYSNEIYESDDTISSLARSQDPFGIPNAVNGFASFNGVRQGQMLGMENPRISEDVVSVPLDDIHVQEVEPQAATEERALPLSDAPLIGAPFRLISFVAKYVSGADLVHKESGRSG